MKMKKRMLSILCSLSLLITAAPADFAVGAANAETGADAEHKAYLVTADDVRVSSKNNTVEGSTYFWPIDFSEDENGARMKYRLQASGAPANSAGSPYMQNLKPVSMLDGTHLKLTLNNEVSSTYGDANFMSRKFVIKLANSEGLNGETNDLRYTFCVNDKDPYIDVMSVTADNVAAQRFYFSGKLDVFGDAVSSYSIIFKVLDNGGLRMSVNGVAVDLATPELLATTSTDITKSVYLYIAADTDYTDITLNSFHGGEKPCLDPTADLAGVAGANTMTDYALGNAGNTDPFLKRTDIAGGGVHIKQTANGAQYPYIYRENMQPLDGLTLRFGNYVSASSKPFAIYLARYENQWFYGVLPTILIDPVKGDLKLIKNIDNATFSGGQYVELATLLTNNALIKTIGSSIFDVSLHKSSDGSSWIVKITSGEYAVAGQFDASIFETAGLGNAPTAELAYLSFGNIDNNATDFEVDFYGYTHSTLGNVTISDIETENINNAKLMPVYRDSVSTADINDNLKTPKWLESAIIAEVNLAKATPAGTIDAAAASILDYYSELGVNCLWIDPVNQKGDNDGYDNGYTNIGADTIEPELTGTDDYTAGWAKLANFVSEAHKRNIRVVLDVVIWGVSGSADTARKITVGGTEKTLADVLDTGDHSGFGGPKYNYTSETFKQWYTETMLNIVKTCNLDGLRVDLEPGITGYDLFANIRSQALASGKQLVIISEHTSDRSAAYDTEQMGLTTTGNWEHDIYTNANASYFTSGGKNIVDAVKNGSASNDNTGDKKYYLYTYRTHDNWYKSAKVDENGNLIKDSNDYYIPGESAVSGSLLDLGYNALFSPYIPVVYMGEATNDRIDTDVTNADPSLYYHGHLNLKALLDSANLAYFNTVKKYISIRRTYADIFESFADDHRNSNIASVDISGVSSYQAYARYANGKAVVIVPNGTSENANVTVTVPSDIGLGANVTVTDLMTDKTISSGNISSFNATVAAGELGVYLIDDGSVETTGCEKNVRDNGTYPVRNADLRFNATNNEWNSVIDITSNENGVRMNYNMWRHGINNNYGKGGYYNNFAKAVNIDGAHLTFSIDSSAYADRADAEMTARKVVFKLSNSEYQNGSVTDLYYLFSMNDSDPYVDIMEVTDADGVAARRVYIDKSVFGTNVSDYDVRFAVRDGGLVLTVNGAEVAKATADIISGTTTELDKPIYIYYGAAYDYTDITMKTFHGGDVKCDVCDSLIGDVNNDTYVDIRDLVRLKQYIAGAKVTVKEVNADINIDSKVNAKDLVALRKLLLTK